MSHVENTSYDIKLNRWMNIQAKSNLITLAVLAALCLAYVAVNIITNELDAKGLVIFCFGCALIMVARLLSHPECLTVTPETVKFRYRGTLFNLLTTGRVRYSSNEDSRYEKTYTVYHIRSIKYLQSPLEKMFSCGHVRICGSVESSDACAQVFVIYGVKDFENTAKWMKSYIRTAND